jgi:S-methylmethionine-dependent homocysteine/selenocysteine methylase
MYDKIAAKLARGETIIIDGGTGTDIQRRGAPMSGDTWCADVNVTHPDIVRQVHEDYVKAGADIVIANTFATSVFLFSHINRLADVARIDAIAVQLAKEAVKGTDVAVAGSISTMRPMSSGSDRNNLAVTWPEAGVRALCRGKTQTLIDSGVDLIMMELLRDTDYAVWAAETVTELANKAGIPVWIGISAERSASGGLQGWGREDCTFDDIARALAAVKPAVMNVMHTSPNDTGEAISILRKYWKGPIGTYPESGYFKSPDWVFVDVISPDELLKRSLEWKAQGATLFGGCCGIGPDHIELLARNMR